MRHASLWLAAAALVVAAGLPGAARAWARYNDGCQNCHGAFTTAPYSEPGGGNWPGSLHEVHRGASGMNTACSLCHTNGDNRNPYLGSSTGSVATKGHGCAGCHGGLISGQARAAGLRAHHARAGVASCKGCHGADATPPAESVQPPYYGSVDTRVRASCNGDGDTSEDWSGDGRGLDNDGDGLYDQNDSDCASTAICGNGVVDAGETCDGASCPASCNDGNVCTADTLTGSASACTAACRFVSIAACIGGDGCCAGGCTSATDSDCSASCGNGVVEAGETCEGASCPASCNDGDACTADTLTGSASVCTAACRFVAITACTGGDGCCAAGCTSATDSDCSATCGNGVVEAGETCEGASCPTACDDRNACTVDVLTGSAAACSAACSNSAVATCVDGDGCCPAGCTSATDGDCSASCGNGTIEAGETCEGSSCPSSCDDQDACTTDVPTGSAAACSAACAHAPVVACMAGDGCCPAGCATASDADCSASASALDESSAGGCGCGTAGGPALLLPLLVGLVAARRRIRARRTAAR